MDEYSRIIIEEYCTMQLSQLISREKMLICRKHWKIYMNL